MTVDHGISPYGHTLNRSQSRVLRTIGVNLFFANCSRATKELVAPVQKHGRVRSTLRWGCHLHVVHVRETRDKRSASGKL